MNFDDEIEIIDIIEEVQKPKKSKKGFIILSLIVLLFGGGLTFGFINREKILNAFFDQKIDTIEASPKTEEKKEEKEVSKSNERDTTKVQIKIINDYVNIRSEANADSEALGEVKKGEIYTVILTTENDYYYWYKIETKTGIRGFVASPKQDVYLDEIDPPYVELLEN